MSWPRWAGTRRRRAKWSASASGARRREADVDALHRGVARDRARGAGARGMTYLDYQATTPLAPEALEAMLPWLRDQHANPHSAHRAGRAAKAAVEVARDQVAALLPPGGRVVFTSGATEALNWAIKGDGGPDRHARDRTCRGARHRRGERARARRHDPAGRTRRAGRSRRGARGDPARHRAGRGDAGQQRDRRDPADRRARRRSRTRPARCSCATRCRAMAACAIPDGVRPDRDLGAQDPRAKGIGALWIRDGVDARAAAARRRAGGRAARARCRRRCAPGSARRRR